MTLENVLIKSRASSTLKIENEIVVLPEFDPMTTTETKSRFKLWEMFEHERELTGYVDGCLIISVNCVSHQD